MADFESSGQAIAFVVSNIDDCYQIDPNFLPVQKWSLPILVVTSTTGQWLKEILNEHACGTAQMKVVFTAGILMI